MERALFCKGCRAQLKLFVPIRGPMSIPFRLLGLRPSKMNPNICNMCETRFTRIWKTKMIVRPASILFADVRGYTSLSHQIGSEQVSSLLSAFYDRCGTAIWERDGIINKLMGDAILAIFNFPIPRQDHVEQAVDAGLELQRRCLEIKSSLGVSGGGADFGIGIAVHTGEVSVGELGQYCKDFTVIGDVVNLGSRLQGVAKPGEVVLSEAVYERVKGAFPGIPAQTFHLKGIDQPVRGYVLSAR